MEDFENYIYSIQFRIRNKDYGPSFVNLKVVFLNDQNIIIEKNLTKLEYPFLNWNQIVRNEILKLKDKY